MARQKRLITKNRKANGTGDLVYVSQNYVSQLIKDKASYARWREEQELKLGGQTGTEFTKTFKQFDKDRRTLRSALRDLQHRAEQEKQQRRSGWQGSGDLVLTGPVPAPPLTLSRPIFFSESEISPSKTIIYHGATANASTQMCLCPDKRIWSVPGLEDDEVSLNQRYRYWFPSHDQHSLLGNYFFSGQFVVITGLHVSGVVDINKNGSVVVDASTHIAVVECTATDSDHDGGEHSNPRYDFLMSYWSSYINGGQQRIFVDTQGGLHDFAYYIEQPAHVLFESGKASRFVEVTHILTITAVNAACTFGPPQSECSAVTPGFIRTDWPIISLQYVGPLPWERGAKLRS